MATRKKSESSTEKVTATPKKRPAPTKKAKPVVTPVAVSPSSKPLTALRSGDVVKVLESAENYSTGGRINPMLFNRPVSVIRVVNGKHALLGRPVHGWVPTKHLTSA